MDPEAPTPPPSLRRLFNGDGRLTAMPVKAALRRELLAWVASTLPTGVVMAEVEINRLLRPIDDDVATLRRYLVEAELVVRPEPGIYCVVGPGTA